MTIPDAFQYDVFLSHSTTDKAVVRVVAERLRGDGLRVWLDERERRKGLPTCTNPREETQMP